MKENKNDSNVDDQFTNMDTTYMASNSTGSSSYTIEWNANE